MINVAVTGACGRMGCKIIRALQKQEDMRLVCAVEALGCKDKGRDVGEVIGIGKIGVEIITKDGLEDALKREKPDCLVDFTNPESAVENVKVAAKKGINVVLGTTGFSEEEMEAIARAIMENNVAAVISPNMAPGMNVFFKIAEETARLLGRESDIEIIEAHHRHKKDSPSGTALKIGGIIAKALGKDLKDIAIFGRPKGKTGERTRGEIGFHAIRAGDIVGEHRVLFAGTGERIEIGHKAHGREAFVEGAIKAIRFVDKGKRGKIYSMQDVLGIG